jgi:hypothetical protein
MHSVAFGYLAHRLSLNYLKLSFGQDMISQSESFVLQNTNFIIES